MENLVKRTRGLFHGQYETHLIPLAATTVKYGGRAFVLPGQGGAYPGMFARQLNTIASFRDRFAQMDQRCADFDLLPASLFITRPAALPSEQIHIYRNCAIYAAEVAMGEYVIQNGLEPKALTGHSFGECAALVLSGLMEFEDMFAVVAYRNLLAPPANKLGLMIAVSGKDSQLEELLREPGVYFANRNSYKQIVISVAASQKDSVLAKMRENRIAHVILDQLPQPYHSPLMEDFRQLLQKRLSSLRLTISQPKFDLFSGVSHSWIDRDNFKNIDFVELLARQATEPVNFVEQIEALREIGISSFYEIGPGSMLETSIRAVSKKSSIAYRDTERLLLGLTKQEKASGATVDKLVNSKWFDKIKNAIQSVAGYKKEDIEITNSFQNDLGIDSIKKAEILFKIIREENIPSGSNFSISQFNTINQAVDYLENYSDSTDPLRQTHEPVIQLVDVLWTESPRPDHVFLRSHISDYKVLRLAPDLAIKPEFFNEAINFSDAAFRGGQKALVVFELHSQEFDPPSWLVDFHEEYVRCLARGRIPSFDVAIVDRSGDQRFRPIATLWKSLRKETIRSRVLYFEADRELTDSEMVGDIVFSATRDLKYEKGKRFVRDYAPFALSGRFSREKPVTVVAIGGSRGINFEVLKNFPIINGDRLVLIGRSPAHRQEVATQLDVLRSRWSDFTYAEADASKFESLRRVITAVLGREAKIDVLFNACGVEVSRRFDEKSREEIELEFATKWEPFQNIERLREENQIEKLIHYSSLVAEFGNRGQVVYAFSNALIEHKCAKSGSQTIAWGPWANVGMTENEGIRARFTEWGVSLAPPDKATALTYRAIFGAKACPRMLKGFDLKDVAMFASDRDIQATESVVAGALQNPFESSFVKDLDLVKEPFLSDHLHNGKPLVSASYLIATFLSFARAQFGRTVSIVDFELQNPTVLNDSHFQLKYQVFYREPHFFQAYSVIPHVSGSFDPNPQWPPKALPDYAVDRHVDLRPFYDTWAIEVGTTYRLAGDAELDANSRLRLKVDTREFPKYIGDEYFDFYLALMEVALQSLSFQANLDIDSVSIPLKCDRISFAPDLAFEGKITVRPFLHRVEKKFWIADIDIQNEAGSTVARIENFKAAIFAKKIPGQLI